MNKMKYYVSIVFILFNSLVNAQNILAVEYPNQCGLKVLVVEYDNQADLLVYKVDYPNQASGNNGYWLFVDYPNQADKRVFFCKLAWPT